MSPKPLPRNTPNREKQPTPPEPTTDREADHAAPPPCLGHCDGFWWRHPRMPFHAP